MLWKIPLLLGHRTSHSQWWWGCLLGEARQWWHLRQLRTCGKWGNGSPSPDCEVGDLPSELWGLWKARKEPQVCNSCLEGRSERGRLCSCWMLAVCVTGIFHGIDRLQFCSKRQPMSPQQVLVERSWEAGGRFLSVCWIVWSSPWATQSPRITDWNMCFKLGWINPLLSWEFGVLEEPR